MLHIVTICGCGMGSSVILKMNAEKALKELGIQAKLEVSDITTGKGAARTADLVLIGIPELEIAHRIGADIIGVNNRNLVTFETDLNTSLELSTHFKDQPVYISESAIFNESDAALVAPYFNGILVGTALMTAGDVAEKVKELQIDKG